MAKNERTREGVGIWIKNHIEKFYEELQDLIDEIPSSGSIILLGDFNARIGATVIAGVKQRFNEHVKIENGNLIIDFCSTNELRINNTFFDHKEQYKYF